jgi:hypothetical protein
MDFLKYVSPDVDWKEGKVTTYVGNKKFILPTCNINSISKISDDNSFAELTIEDTDSH